MAARNPERPPADGINPVGEDHESALKAQAERCRRLAAATYNREMAQSLDAMAEDYERTADEVAKKRNP